MSFDVTKFLKTVEKQPKVKPTAKVVTVNKEIDIEAVVKRVIKESLSVGVSFESDGYQAIELALDGEEFSIDFIDTLGVDDSLEVDDSLYVL